MARYALLIGTDTYEDSSFTDLLVPGKDIEGLHSVLVDKNICGIPDENTQILLNKSISEVSEAVGAFYSGKKKDDLLLFYFSGHGELDEHGDLYLALNKTDKSNLMGTTLPASMLEITFKKSNSTKQVIILDCCYSGVLSSGDKSTNQAKELDNWKGHGREILTSSSSAQKSWEASSLDVQSDKSLFTHFLVEGLKTGKASEDELITVDQLFIYAKNKVTKQTNRMTPERRVENQRENIVLAKNPLPPLKLPKELLSGLVDSNWMTRQGAVQALDEEYIKQGDPSSSSKVLKLLRARLSSENKETDYRVRISIEAVLAYSLNQQHGSDSELENAPHSPPPEVPLPTKTRKTSGPDKTDPNSYNHSRPTENSDTRNSNDSTITQPFSLGLIPIALIIGLLPFTISFDDYTFYPYYLVLPIAAWMGQRFGRYGLITLAIVLFPMSFYEVQMGAIFYGRHTGDYFTALIICWACSNPEKWWSKPTSLDLGAMSLLVILIAAESSINIIGDFGSIGWTGYSSPLLLAVFALGISGTRGLTIIVVSLIAAAIGFSLNLLDFIPYEKDLGNGLSRQATYRFDSLRDLFQVLFVFALGRVIGMARNNTTDTSWLFSWPTYVAFLAIWMFNGYFLTLRLWETEIGRVSLSGSEVVLWVLAFTVGVIWKSKAVIPFSIAIVVCFLQSYVLTVFDSNSFELNFGSIGIISIWIMETSYLINIFLPAILFYIFGKRVGNYLATPNGIRHADPANFSNSSFVPYMVSPFVVLTLLIAILTLFAQVHQPSDEEDKTSDNATIETCKEPTPEVLSAIYVAKLKNARSRNVGLEWEKSAALIQLAEEQAAECNNARALTLANMAKALANARISQYHSSKQSGTETSD